MTKSYNSKSDSDRSDKNENRLNFAQKVAIEVKSRVVAIHGRFSISTILDVNGILIGSVILVCSLDKTTLFIV